MFDNNRNIGYVDNTSLANGTERSDTPCPERWQPNIFFVASDSEKVKHQYNKLWKMDIDGLGGSLGSIYSKSMCLLSYEFKTDM